MHNDFFNPSRRASRTSYSAAFLLVSVVFCVLGVLCSECPAQTAPQTDAASEAQRIYTGARALERLNRLAEAQSMLVTAHSLSPSNAEIEVALGKLDSVLGRLTEAIDLFRHLETVNPEAPENASNLAIALAAHGDRDEALRFATKAVERDKDSVEAHHLRGKLLVDLNRPVDAQAEFEEALKLAPSDAATLYDFAILREAGGQTNDEVVLLRRLIRVRPEDANDHFLLGRALAHSGNEVAARVEFLETTRLDPKNRAALYGLSRSLQRENPAEAERFAARFRALKLSEDEMNSVRDEGNRGVRAMQAGDWHNAILIFQAVLRTCSGCELEATLEKDLGLAQCQSGDTRAGAATLRRSLALNPTDVDVLRAIRIAEAGKPQPN